MKAKEYLQQLKRLDIVIKQKSKEVDDLHLKSKSIGSIDYSKERVQTSPSGEASFVKLIGRIVDLEAEISQEINNFIDEKHKIINQIQKLNNTDYIRLLYKRYVEYKSLEHICVEMDFSYDYIKHLHGCALKDFEDKILKSTLNST
ncbi:MAG: hypothetical protein HFJ03_04950 [Lachnospira sp.]|nr:hypothetical protein [Lachnospira sp.]